MTVRLFAGHEQRRDEGDRQYERKRCPDHTVTAREVGDQSVERRARGDGEGHEGDPEAGGGAGPVRARSLGDHRHPETLEADQRHACEGGDDTPDGGGADRGMPKSSKVVRNATPVSHTIIGFRPRPSSRSLTAPQPTRPMMPKACATTTSTDALARASPAP